MSIKVALDNICLEPTSRWAHTEYSLDYHKDYLAKRTGLASDAEAAADIARQNAELVRRQV